MSAVTTPSSGTEPILAVDGLKVHFPVRGGLMPRPKAYVRAVDGVSFAIGQGETLGLVGESGCGKSTTGLALMGLVKPTEGSVRLDGTDIASLSGLALKASRRRMQVVFQDPYSSLNPRQRVGDIIRAPLDIHGIGTVAERTRRIAELMRLVGLSPDQASAYPHQFSGGQRQRIGIARALASEPGLVICDEPVSALDVSVQAQILNLLVRLQADLGVSFLFISHDLGVVAHVSHRVAVMYLGKIVEIGTLEAIFGTPRHPYTELLFHSAPATHPRERHRVSAEESEEVADALTVVQGCSFHPRCPLAMDRCRVETPALTVRDDGRALACHVR